MPNSILRRLRILLCLLSAVALSGSVVNAQRNLKEIPPPDPELERQTFVLPDGFSVNLFAADPRIAKPIHMNFDPQGRLWIAGSEVYPHIEPGARESDRVLVIEDTDADGTADLTHVFAEGLLIPTGIAPDSGGAFVANSTELLYFADEDGDLKADSRRIVLSGFGTEDTHHILHSLRWGPAGALYMNQSIYIHSHVETPWGVRRLNAGGIWEFRPKTLELGVLMYGLVNPWGHHFDRYGQSFATDGAGGEGINYIIPGASYFTAADAKRILHGLNPGSPKHCGLELVSTPGLPPEWQGNAITNDFRGHRVCRFVLRDNGAGFDALEQQEVIRSDHTAFRPVDVKLGPDGALYIADWYNPIIQHGEVDFRDDRRDHTHGRIWRVTWDQAPALDHRLPRESPTEILFKQLVSDDSFARQAARERLWDLPAGTAAALSEYADRNPEHREPLLMESLWLHHAHRIVNEPLLQTLLASKKPEIRAAAVRQLSHWKSQITNFPSLIETALEDGHPRVRLEAVRAASYSPLQDSEPLSLRSPQPVAVDSASVNPSASLVEACTRILNQPLDRFLDYALWLTLQEQADSWIPAFETGVISFDDDGTRLQYAFTAAGDRAPTDALTQRLLSGGMSAEQTVALTELAAARGNVQQLSALARHFLSAPSAGAALDVLTSAAARRKMTLSIPADAITTAMASDNVSQAASAARLAGVSQFAEREAALNEVLRQPTKPFAVRIAAAEGLLATETSSARRSVLQAASQSTAPLIERTSLLQLLAGIQPQAVVSEFLTLIRQEEVAEDPGLKLLAETILSVKGNEARLTAGLAGLTLPPASARLLLSELRNSGRSSPQLESVIRASGSLTERRMLSAEEIRDVLQQVDGADPARGEALFRAASLRCQSCHAIGGAGGAVGPDMISLGASARPDYLLESLLMPNAKIKENYNTTTVVTESGKVVSGIRIAASRDSVTLRLADNTVREIPASSIEETADGLSLMPEGLVDSLTQTELADLVRFLSELGRTPDYSISRIPAVRSWQTMQAGNDAAYTLRRISDAEATTDNSAFTWKPAWSQVNGELPLQQVPVVSVRNRSASGSRGVGFVRFLIEVEQPGDVALSIPDTSGLRLWNGHQPVDPADRITLTLPRGTHRITVAADTSARTAPLQISLIPDQTTAVARFDSPSP